VRPGDGAVLRARRPHPHALRRLLSPGAHVPGPLLGAVLLPREHAVLQWVLPGRANLPMAGHLRPLPPGEPLWGEGDFGGAWGAAEDSGSA
jgi:hypothetical protein